MKSHNSLLISFLASLGLTAGSCSKSQDATPASSPGKYHSVGITYTINGLDTQRNAAGQPGADMGGHLACFFDGTQRKEVDFPTVSSATGPYYGFSNVTSKELRIDLDFRNILRTSSVPVSSSANITIIATVDGNPATSTPIVLDRNSPYRASGNMGTSTTIDLTKF